MKSSAEKEAFRALYEESAPVVGRLLFSALFDELDAEDLCQEIYLRRWATYPDGCSTGEVLRAAIRLHRRYRKRASDARYAPLGGPAGSGAATPSAKLRMQWNALPLSERMAVALLLPGGVPVRTAGAALGAGEGAIRKRAARGIVRLGLLRKGSSPGRLPPLCDTGTKRLLSGDWAAHAAACRKCSRAVPFADEGIRAATRATTRAFPARTKGRLLRRLLKDLPALGATLRYGSMPSPIGRIWIGLVEGAVVGIGIGGEGENDFVRRFVPGSAPRAVPDPAAIRAAAKELDEYFAGKRKRFTFPHRLVGVSPFQAEVLAACARVPFGGVSSYGELAEQIGRPRATRAVGGALGSNPLPVVIPCHRILSSRGRLHGFSGGLAAKEKLLAVEGRAGLFSVEPRD